MNESEREAFKRLVAASKKVQLERENMRHRHEPRMNAFLAAQEELLGAAEEVASILTSPGAFERVLG